MTEHLEVRNCGVVIDKMMSKIPEQHTEFLKALKWNREDASYKAPEQKIQWQRTMETLMEHIPTPRKTWEFEVLSIFTTRSIAELKELHKEEEE